tara:strand:+ start:281 stop:652 length:372 start_codon:yes stop_codon:yes gene_type:complete
MDNTQINTQINKMSNGFVINWSSQERIPIQTNEDSYSSEVTETEHSQSSEEMIEEIKNLKEELEFYKSLFVSRRNSCIFNLKIKKMNGKNVWVDRVRDQREDFLKLDRDEEVEEWLQPIRCER